MRGFWRTIERVLVVEPDEKEVCNLVVFTLLHTVAVCFLYVPLLSCRSASVTLKCVEGFFCLFFKQKTFFTVKTLTLRLHYQMKSVIPALLNSNGLMLIHNDLSR